MPHDLIQLDPKDVISFTAKPEWLHRSLETAPFVVVRRAPIMGDLVPIGIRGDKRNQRFAAFIPFDKIILQITPEQLAEQKGWRKHPRSSCIAALGCLEWVDSLFSEKKLAWGPTGSVGFELASGVAGAKPTSDLDLVVRVPAPLDRSIAKALDHDLSQAAVHIDVQLDTPGGIISLSEYSRGESPLLVRTENGPALVRNPWVATNGMLERKTNTSPSSLADVQSKI